MHLANQVMNKHISKITVVITGHKVLTYSRYIKYLIHSLTGSLDSCKFIVYYDKSGFKDTDNLDQIVDIFKLYNISNYEVKFAQGGLHTMFYHLLTDVKTPYVLFLEHDWIFNKLPNWQNIVKAMDNNNFVKCIYFKKSRNVAYNIPWSNDVLVSDIQNNDVKLETDPRVIECDLISCAYWCNNPFICTLKQIL